MSVSTPTPVSTDQPYNPDADTAERIKNLAIVAKALNERFSEHNEETGEDFFLAKEGLLKFKAGIDKLNLDPSSKEGMYALIDMLQKMIDDRLNTKSPLNL